MAGVRKGRGRELACHAGYYTNRVYYTSVLGAIKKEKGSRKAAFISQLWGCRKYIRGIQFYT